MMEKKEWSFRLPRTPASTTKPKDEAVVPMNPDTYAVGWSSWYPTPRVYARHLDPLRVGPAGEGSAGPASVADNLHGHRLGW